MIITGGKQFNSHRAANLGLRYGIDSGVQRLIETPLVINGAEGSTILRFRGSDASAAGWPEVGNAGTLALQAGTAPTYGVPGPWGGATPDLGCKFNAGGYFKAASSALGNPGTVDAFVELVYWRHATGASPAQVVKTTGASQSRGLQISHPYVFIRGSGNRCYTQAPVLATFGLTYQSVLLNMSENCTNGLRFFWNGSVLAEEASESSPSAIDDMTNAGFLTIGANSDGLAGFSTDGILLVGIHYRSAWHQDGAAGLAEALAIHNQRFALLTGTRPLISIAASTSLAAGGNVGQAYQSRIVSSADRLFYMGAGAPRFVERVDGAGRTFRAALVEAGDTSYVGYNRAFASWSKEGVPTITDGFAGPDGALSADKIEGITGVGGVTIYEANVTGAGANGTVVRPSLWIKRISTSGVLNILSSAGAGFGRITCDLAGLPDAWVRLHGASAYCTLVANHVAWGDTGRSGLWLTRSSGADPLSFYADLAQVQKDDHPSSEILVPTTVAVTRAADTPHRISGAHFGQKEGSIHFKFLSPSFTPGRSHYLWTAYQSGLAATNYMTAYLDTSGRLNIATATPGGNSGSIQYASNLCDNLIHTCCLSWKNNSLSLRVDGLWATVDTLFTPNPSLDTFDIGADNTAALQAGPVLVGDCFVYPTERSSRIIPPWGG